MLSSPRVIVTSAFGRGHWISVMLHRLGFNVQLLDVTNRVGSYQEIDQEGPFGFFVSKEWKNLEFDSLCSQGPAFEQKAGYTLWLKNGPWELRGETSNHRSKTLKQAESALQYSQTWGQGRGLNRNTLFDKNGIDKFKDIDFEERWISSFASDLLSNESSSSNEAYLKASTCSIFEKYWTRYPEHRNINQSLQWCKEQGVTVIEDAQIPDLSIENHHIQGIEVNAQKSGFIRCHQLVWLLTSQETSFLSPRAFLKLFKGKTLEPEWTWLRYQIEFEPSRDFDQLPHDFIWIDDILLPWYHDNFVIFRKSTLQNTYHVWLRLPYSQRFHREYLEQRIQPLIEKIKMRNPRLKCRNLTLPEEAKSHFKDLGASLFPLYRSQDLDQPTGIKLKNLWFNQPEYWTSYSWDAILKSQNHIINELRHWWGELSAEQKEKELHL